MDLKAKKTMKVLFSEAFSLVIVNNLVGLKVIYYSIIFFIFVN